MSSERSALRLGILVAALGYFVDVYDLVLFSVVRRPSLLELGLSGEALISEGLFLLNVQNTGLLLGGILWGVLGDKRGRISVLFGSILLYSIANIANGFVQSVEAYALWRFLAGLGLAGELGAGITLVSEMMPKENRGYGTTLVASVGVAGAIAAGLIGEELNWRAAYWSGGVMGFLLLGLRVALHESGMFKALASSEAARGDLRMLVNSRSRLTKFIACVAVGIPTWFVVAILITLAPEFGKEFGMLQLPSAARAVMFAYIGFVLGDICSGLLSQLLASRRKAMAIFICMSFFASATYLFALQGAKLSTFYLVCSLLGFAGGYWAVCVSSAAEHFGTNLRATVATTVPNLIRGSAVLVVALFDAGKGTFGMINSATLVSALCILVALLALSRLPETFGKDLDFLEK